MIIRSLLVAMLFCFVGGCTAGFKTERPAAFDGDVHIEPDASIMVGPSEDGAFNNEPALGSGDALTRAVVRAFSKHVADVDVRPRPTSARAGMSAARREGFDYYIDLTILHWEDRATEWSGKSARISVRLRLYETRSQDLIDSIVIDGKSKWATFGGDKPEDLLRKPIERYAAEVCEPRG